MLQQRGVEVVTAACCVREKGPSRPFSRRIAGTAASAMPGVALVLLPKCPLCLAAWLAAGTGIGFARTLAASAPAILVLLWILGVALTARQFIVRRRGRQRVDGPAVAFARGPAGRAA